VADETKGDRTPNPTATLRLFEESKRRLLLIGRGGLHGNCLRVSPPLTVSGDEVDEALGKLDESFTAIGA
jgi:4-aminobutyrate aminotransferase-like enzyme